MYRTGIKTPDGIFYLSGNYTAIAYFTPDKTLASKYIRKGTAQCVIDRLTMQPVPKALELVESWKPIDLDQQIITFVEKIENKA